MYMRGYHSPRAFTLTEILIVIGIIVLFITLALPAFNLIGGSKSIAGAENEIGALLGEVRSQAVGVQDYRGLAIYRDAVSDRYCGAVVSAVTWSGYPSVAPFPGYPQYSYVTYNGHNWVAVQAVPGSSTTPSPYAPGTAPAGYWSPCDSSPSSTTMDITPDSDVQTFPAGVGVQVINNCAVTGSTRQSNGYLPIGIILFNGEGLLKLNNVSIAVNGHLGTIGAFAAYSLQTNPNQGAIPYYNPTATPQGLPLSSSFGLVAYDKQSFDTQNFYSSLSPQFPTQLTSTSINGLNGKYNSTTADGAADTWLDTNATPLLINRYNGTLIRSE